MDPSPFLDARVSSLEFEVRKLQQRIAALERGETWTEPVAAPRVIVPPPEPEPAEIAVPATEPPPLPMAMAREATRPPRAESRPPAEPSFVHELLATLQLIPPRAGTSGEAQLGAWWATRIGALLAVIGVVFFGITLSAHTTPLVRWIELAAIAVGTSWAGAHFERRRLRIGSVVTGAGLALTYFAAFAAYAVPAVKIIDAVAVAALLQGAAVVYVGMQALRRNSATIAFFAVLLGYVSAFVSLEAGLGGFAAVAGLGLSVTAIAYLRSRNWMGPAYASAALSPLLNIVLAVVAWSHPTNATGAVLPFAFIAAGFGVHLFPLWCARGTDSPLRIMQTMQTAMHVLAALVTTLAVFGEGALSTAFFATGGTLTLVSVWLWRTRPDDRMLGMFAVKAASLLALGIIAEWDARTRWIALLVEALVLLAGSARTRRPALLAMSLFVAAGSLAFYSVELAHFTGPLVSSTGLAIALYVIVGAVFLTFANAVWNEIAPTQEARPIVLAAAAAIPAQLAAIVSMGEPWMMVACIGLIGALEGVRRWQRSIVPVPAMGVLALNAHIALQSYAESAASGSLLWLWGGALGLAALMFAAVGAIRRIEAPPALRVILIVAGHAALAGAVLQSVPRHPALLICTAMAVGLAWAGRRRANPELLAGGAFSLATGAALAFGHAWGSVLPAGDPWWSALTALGLPLLWAITSERRAPGLVGAQWAAAAVGVFMIWMPLLDLTTTTYRGLATTAVALLLAWQARGLALRPARLLTGTVAAFTAINLMLEIRWTSHPHPLVALVGVLALGLGLALLPLWWHRTAADRSGAWSALLGVAGAGVLTWAALAPSAPWRDYGSGLWAVAGLGVFGLGLVCRARSHRIIGLALIALCIPRVFVHDINDAKHRIIAFILLGVLLIWVGFSYQRFRHLIDGTRPDERPDADAT